MKQSVLWDYINYPDLDTEHEVESTEKRHNG